MPRPSGRSALHSGSRAGRRGERGASMAQERPTVPYLLPYAPAAWPRTSRSSGLGEDRWQVLRLFGRSSPADRQVARLPARSESCSRGTVRGMGRNRNTHAQGAGVMVARDLRGKIIPNGGGWVACRHISHEWKRSTGAVTLRSSSLGTPSARNDFADSCNLPARRDVYIEINQTVAMMASAFAHRTD